MKAVTKEERRVAHPLVLNFLLLAAGIATAVIGLLTLLGWVFKLPLLTSFRAGLIPMAPSTAFLFLLYGVAVCLRVRTPLGQRAFRISVAMVGLGTVIALLLFALGCLNIHLSIEHPGLNLTETVRGAPIGHMSTVNAFCFLLASLSFLASLPTSATRPWRSVLALGAAGLIVGTHFIFLLAYIYGTPLLYGSKFLPPALNSALNFVMLGLGLLALAGRPARLSGGMPGEGSRTMFAFALIFTLLAAGIVTVGYRSYRNYERNFYAAAERQLSAIADLKVEELVQFRKERLEDGGFFLNNDGFSVLVQRYLKDPEDVDAEWQIQEWAGKLMATGQYDHVRLLDAQGATRLSAPVGLPQVTFVSQRIRQVLGSNHVTFRDLHLNEIDHRAYMNIMVPIFEEQDVRRPLGVFYLRIDPEKYLYPIIQRWPTPSQTAEILLLRRDGNDALYLNDLRCRTNAALNLRVSLEQTNVPAVRAALGQTGITQGLDYRGVPVIAAVRAVPGSPWFLVAKIDKVEVYAPLRERLRLTALFTSLLLIGAGLGIGIFWRQQRVRFYKERYQIAEALRESEERFRRVFEEGPTGMVMLDETFRFIRVNPAFAAMLGYSEEELQKMTFTDVTHPDHVQKDVEQVRRLLRGELAAYRTEKRYIAKSGKELWGQVQVSVVRNTDGTFRNMLAIIGDIGALKQAEQELRSSETKFRMLYDTTSDAVMLLDEKGFFDCNPATLALYGCATREEFCTKHPADVSPPTQPEGTDSRTLANQRIAMAREKGTNHFEWIHQRTDTGETFLADVLLNAMELDGRPVLQAVVRDITVRKRAEDELRRSNEALASTHRLLQAMLDNIPDRVYFKDTESRFIKISRSLAERLGVTDPEEAVGKTDVDYQLPDQAREFYEDDQRIIRTGEPLINKIEKHIALNGDISWSSTTKMPLRDSAGKVIGLAGINRDITEIKRAEDSLRESRALYSSLVDQLPVGVFRKDPAGRYVLVNPWFCRLKGMKAEEFLGRLPEEVAVGETAKQDPIELAVKYAAAGGGHHEQIMRTGKPIELVEEYTGPDGRNLFVRAMKLAVFDPEGRIIGTQGILSDITEIKRAEDVLRRSHEEFKDLFDNAPVGFHEVDAEGRLVRINNTELKMLGYSAEELLGQFVWKISGDEEASRQAVMAKLRGESPPLQLFERMFRRKDGSIFPVLINDRILKGKDGAIIGIRGAIQDDTERKQAAESMRASENRLRTLLQTIPDLVWLKDAKGVFLFCNPAFERLFGAKESAIVGKTDYDFVDKSLADFFRKRDEAAMAADGPTTNEEWLTFALDGYCGLFQTLKTPVHDENGALVGVLGVARDITARKRAEEAVRESEEKHRVLIETTATGFVIVDAKGSVIDANAEYVRLAGYEKREQILGRSVTEWTAAHDQARNAEEVKKCIASGVVRGLEVDYVHPDGTVVPIEINASTLGKGDNLKILTLCRDITERKRATETLRLNQERLLKVVTQTRCILNSGQVEGPADWRERALKPESPFRWDFPVQNEETAQKILPLELAPGEKYQQAWTRSRNHDDHTQMNWNSGNAFLNDLPFYRNEFRCTDKYGVGHWMQQFVTVRKLAENRWEAFGITMDISDLKRIETELRESQALYLSLVNQMPAGVFRKDAKGRYVLVNSAFCQLQETTPDQYLGKTARELKVGDVALATKGAAHHETIMQSGNIIEDDEVFIRPNGETRYFHAVKTPVLDFAGKIIGTQGILFDNTELMQATQRVADALNFNQTVLRASPVGIVVFKASGPCVSANEAIEQIAGGKREEILKQNFRQLESWKNAGMLAAAEDALAAQAERNLETQSVTTFGRKAWFSCRFVPFRYQGESHLLLAINDITERKRAVDTLRQSEEMLKRSQHVAKLGHYTLNAISGDWEGSKTLDDVFGIDATFKKDVAGWSKLIYPEDRDVMSAYFQDHVLKKHNPFDKEYRIVRAKDGSVRWVHGIGELRFNASGEVAEMFGTIQDITERKRADQALRWSETQLQVILESTADGILAVDSQGKTIVANQRFAELWRIPQSLMEVGDDHALLDFAIRQLIDPDAFLNKVKSLYGTDALDMDTLAFKDGRIYERYSFPMMMDGTVIGRVWSFRDITERKRQERLLSEKNTELERFTYTVSHDLKSPLVTVKTFLGYLEQDMAGTDKERVKQDVTYMHNAADKMGLLLDELLNLARVGRKTNPAERITFKELTREVIRLVTGRIIANGVEVKVADVDMVLEGDRPRLMEVWQNLVENACKFMGNQPKPRVEIGVEQRGSETVFFVRDNGVGIEPRFQAKVFGLFEKLDPKGEGTGMGLALVKRIVEMYKGRIWVESAGPGQGANFLFTLPGAVNLKPEQSS